ncbi:hypothetical protein EVA_21984 [gut metagenome]|uniref:Uncharacterized protein n=1 Tax=gut metagenome TaxID=749906 RepID=J9FRA1_9ZZZZ
MLFELLRLFEKVIPSKLRLVCSMFSNRMNSAEYQ